MTDWRSEFVPNKVAGERGRRPSGTRSLQECPLLMLYISLTSERSRYSQESRTLRSLMICGCSPPHRLRSLNVLSVRLLLYKSVFYVHTVYTFMYTYIYIFMYTHIHLYQRSQFLPIFVIEFVSTIISFRKRLNKFVGQKECNNIHHHSGLWGGGVRGLSPNMLVWNPKE